MRLPVRRDRRIVGRPPRARFHRDTPAGGCIGAQRHALLVDPARRDGESQRRADAVADCEHAIAPEFARSACAGIADMGRGAVPRPRLAARPMVARP